MIRDSNIPSRKPICLPIVLFSYVWLFFPNSPVSRLGPQEVLTVFFLAASNYVAAVTLYWKWQAGAGNGRIFRRIRSLLLYIVFLLLFSGLALSKEVNVLLSTVLLVAYVIFSILLMKANGWRSSWVVVSTSPMIAVVLLAGKNILARMEVVGVGYSYDAPTVDTMVINSNKVLLQLFQVHTSVFVTAGFVVLLGGLCLAARGLMYAPVKPADVGQSVVGSDRRGRSAIKYQLAFLLLVGTQFLAFFAALVVSWGVSLRYWYPLVPLLALLLAFGAKFVLQAASAIGARIAMIAFVVYFCACNYYNLAFQTIAWHSLSNAEERLIEHVRDLVDRGRDVVIDPTGRELECSLVQLARLQGRDFAVHVELPTLGSEPFYFVTRKELPQAQLVTTIVNRREYEILAIAGAVARALQWRDEPFLLFDHGVMWRPDMRERPYAWRIYRMAADALSALPAPQPCSL